MKSLIDHDKKQLTKVLHYQKLFESEFGKHVLNDLMKRYHVFTPMKSDNPQELAMKEGQRSVVLDILTKLKIDTIKREQLIKEYEQHDNYGI